MSVTFADVEAAAARIAGHAVRTPLIESPALNERVGGRVLIKPETLQRVGAFKFRGAYNRLVQFTPDERAKGAVAFSSGNHAQGVALAGRLLGVPTLIVMPADAPAVKIEATRGYGAEIRLYDRFTEDRVAIAEAIRDERGMTVVPSFDDPHIIAGQGTAGLELVRQAEALGARLDCVVSPIGGGGLIGGVGLAVKALSPATAVVGVEPIDFDDALRSLQAGTAQTIDPHARSICDALLSPSPSELTLSVMRKTVADVALVTDAEVTEAMRYAFQTLKLVVEPGGAVGLAALLAGKVRYKGETTGLILSGGNVDPAMFAQVLAGEL
ncbi:MAG: threonine/serine dehydratase [Caulobacteraceae bacterium]|nr:threonine/serine dehydratase [Caulobacteraceae bacterium]